MDNKQLAHFLDCMIGFKSIGTAGDQEIQAPISPELRSFIIGRLGEETPSCGYQALKRIDETRALARLLREALQGLDRFHLLAEDFGK